MPQLRSSVLIPALAIAALPLLHFEAPLDPVWMPRFTFWATITFLMGVTLFFKFRKTKSPGFPQELMVTMALFLMSGLISSPQALAPTEAWLSLGKDFLMMVFALFLFLQLRQNQNDGDSIIAKGILVFGLFLVGWASYECWQLAQSVGWENMDFYAVKGRMAHRNLLASALLLSLPFGFYVAWHLNRSWKVAAIIGVVLIGSLLIVLGSRASLVGLAGFLLAFGILILWRRFGNSQLHKALRYYALIFLVFLGLCFSYLYFFNPPFSEEAELTSELSLSGDEEKNFTARERILLWKATGTLIFDQPITGVGPGQWKIHFPKYGSEIWRSRQGMVQFQRPHNDFLWVLSEQGILGLLAYLALFGVTFLTGFRILIQNSASQKHKNLTQLLLAGLVAYLVVSLFSFPRERIVHQVILFTSIALIFALADPRHLKVTLRGKSVPVAVLSLLMLPLIYMGYQRWQGEKVTRKILQDRVAANWSGLLRHYHSIEKSFFYQVDPSSLPIDFYAGLAYLNMEDLYKAERHFQEAYLLHPYNIHVINNLASTYQIKGEPTQSIYFYEKAIQIAPFYKDGVLNLASAYFNNNQVNKAYQSLAQKADIFEPDSERYQTYALTILKTIRDNLADNAENSELQKHLLSLNDDALLQIHRKAKENPQNINKYLLDF